MSKSRGVGAGGGSRPAGVEIDGRKGVEIGGGGLPCLVDRRLSLQNGLQQDNKYTTLRPQKGFRCVKEEGGGCAVVVVVPVSSQGGCKGKGLLVTKYID